YPNPTDAILNIQAEGVELLSVSVYDNMGRLLLTKSVDQEKSELDVSQLSLGTYYLQVVTPKEVLQYKVLKK
ncbi:MAG: T9SS type A sorting domain-containing protein, partial [Paludibacteraceae bacterium]|nr:T9SS type A sorting domain-containing protein [Paludibacteraceae bacterium]